MRIDEGTGVAGVGGHCSISLANGWGEAIIVDGTVETAIANAKETSIPPLVEDPSSMLRVESGVKRRMSATLQKAGRSRKPLLRRTPRYRCLALEALPRQRAARERRWCWIERRGEAATHVLTQSGTLQGIEE